MLVALWILTMSALVSTLFMAFAVNPVPVIILLFAVSTLTLWQLLGSDKPSKSRTVYFALIVIWLLAFIWETYGIVVTLSHTIS